MKIWQLQEAKAKFSEVVKLCKEEPQIVSVRGQNEAVILSMDNYKALLKNKPSFLDLIRKSPLFDTEMDFTRDNSFGREIDL